MYRFFLTPYMFEGLSDKMIEKQMQVLYILPYKWGGLCHYTIELANAVSKYAKVAVITAKGFDGSYFNDNVEVIQSINSMDFSTDNPMRAFSFSNLPSLFPSPNLKRTIGKIKPDVIHLTTLLAPPLSSSILFYRLDKKYPLILTKHGIFSDSSGVVRVLESLLLLSERLAKFQRIIVHDQKDKETLIRRNSSSASKISIIPHGIYSFFTEFGQEIAPEKGCILFFGYIKQYKGLEYLLKAVPLVSQEVPNLKVIIAGEGDLSLYKSLLKDADESRFEIHNEFVTNEKAAELFKRAEIVVLPYSTMRSGQSGILHIAYAFSKPVVATNVGGIPEVLEDGKTGYIVPPQDASALADGLVKLLKNDELKEEMSRNIDKKVGDLSWDAVAQKTLAVYREVVAGVNSI